MHFVVTIHFCTSTQCTIFRKSAHLICTNSASTQCTIFWKSAHLICTNSTSTQWTIFRKSAHLISTYTVVQAHNVHFLENPPTLFVQIVLAHNVQCTIFRKPAHLICTNSTTVAHNVQFFYRPPRPRFLLYYLYGIIVRSSGP